MSLCCFLLVQRWTCAVNVVVYVWLWTFIIMSMSVVSVLVFLMRLGNDIYHRNKVFSIIIVG